MRSKPNNAKQVSGSQKIMDSTGGVMGGGLPPPPRSYFTNLVMLVVSSGKGMGCPSNKQSRKKVKIISFSNENISALSLNKLVCSLVSVQQRTGSISSIRDARIFNS